MIVLLLSALLAIADPVGDTAGDGSLRPPTSGIYAGTASFDLLDVSLLDAPNLSLAITLAAYDNPADLANGFTHPIIEVYLDSGEGGETELLPGSTMRLPAGYGWDTALRITGDRVEVHSLPPGGDRVLMGAEVGIDDGRIVVETPLPSPEATETTLFAIVGVYDPFAEQGWRAVSSTPSPWAFSSEQPQLPVIDLLALSDSAQAAALRSGVLPLNSTNGEPVGVPWLLLMGFGVLVAVLGLGMRSRVSQGDGAEVVRDVGVPALAAAATEAVPAAAAVPSGSEGTVAAPAAERGPGDPAAPAAERGPSDPAARAAGSGAVAPPIVIGREGRTARKPRSRPIPPPTAATPGHPSAASGPAAERLPLSAPPPRRDPAPDSEAAAAGIAAGATGEATQPAAAEPQPESPLAGVGGGTGGSAAGRTLAPGVAEAGSGSDPVRPQRRAQPDDGGDSVPRGSEARSGVAPLFDDPAWESDDPLGEPAERRWTAVWEAPGHDDDEP